MLLGARECCGGQWAAVPLFFVHAGGRGGCRWSSGSSVPSLPRLLGGHAEGFQSTWPPAGAARPGPWALASAAGLAGQPGHFINLSDKIPGEVCYRADRGRLYLPWSTDLTLMWFFLKEGHWKWVSFRLSKTWIQLAELWNKCTRFTFLVPTGDRIMTGITIREGWGFYSSVTGLVVPLIRGHSPSPQPMF